MTGCYLPVPRKGTGVKLRGKETHATGLTAYHNRPRAFCGRPADSHEGQRILNVHKSESEFQMFQPMLQDAFKLLWGSWWDSGGETTRDGPASPCKTTLRASWAQHSTSHLPSAHTCAHTQKHTHIHVWLHLSMQMYTLLSGTSRHACTARTSSHAQRGPSSQPSPLSAPFFQFHCACA